MTSTTRGKVAPRDWSSAISTATSSDIIKLKMIAKTTHAPRILLFIFVLPIVEARRPSLWGSWFLGLSISRGVNLGCLCRLDMAPVASGQSECAHWFLSSHSRCVRTTFERSDTQLKGEANQHWFCGVNLIRFFHSLLLFYQCSSVWICFAHHFVRLSVAPLESGFDSFSIS